MEAEPTAGLVEQFGLAADGCVDSKDDFVFPLVCLVDVTSDEVLPLRHEGSEIEGGQGRLHSSEAKTRALLND